jgi:glucose-6-phosphate 1-epimerase
MVSPLSPTLEHRLFQGLPVLCLSLPGGDGVQVALHGAQVLSWVAGGRERLYLSPRALLDGQTAIRGGVPLCFPQFNQRGPLPKHGFARNLPWTVQAQDAGVARIGLSLCDSDATRAFWLQAFEATLTVDLQPGSLQVTLAVRNTDAARPLRFTGALHTYLAVDDIAGVRLEGLQGQACWDALTDQHATAAPGAITFNGEFDRVYAAAPAPLTLHDGPHRLQIAQSASLSDTVVWNPGAGLCSRLNDMPAEGFARMLCVEAAQVQEPVELACGSTWQGWQRLTV